MAAGKVKLYDLAKKRIGDGTIDLDTNAIKAALFLSTSNCNTLSVGTGLLADLTNPHATANGYPAGGVALTSVTWTNVSGVVTFTAGNIVYNASGGSIIARFVVIYQSGLFNGVQDALIGVSLLDTTPADITTTSGNSFTISPNASGMFSISGATID
jgi:hypothetical protein